MVDSEKLAGKSLRSTLEWCLAGFLSGEFACHINRRMFSSAGREQYYSGEDLVFHSRLDPYSKPFAELSPLRSFPSNGGRAPSCVAMFG